jgi:hypothetical protein
MNYPHLHHLGFKLLCGMMMVRSVHYMDMVVYQQEEQIKLLKRIQNNTGAK